MHACMIYVIYTFIEQGTKFYYYCLLACIHIISITGPSVRLSAL